MTDETAYVMTHWGAFRHIPGPGAGTFVPFSEDPAPSGIGEALAETLSDPCRIATPCIRRGWLEGDSGAARGEDDFIEVGWDEALDRAAAELERVRRDHGHAAIYAGSYGWASAGRFHHAQSQLRRFFGLFGGATRSVDSYSYAAGEVILPHVVAPMDRLLTEHTAWAAITAARATVLALGGISLRNSQMNSGGLARHTQPGDLKAALAAGVRVINASPVRDPDLLCDAEWLAIRPGTDMALMLALAQVLVAEHLHDQAFLDRYTTGFERFRPYLTGASDGVVKSPEWAASLTGLPAARIRQLARELASGPAVISVSWSLTRQENGEQNYWMAVVLAAMLGGIGRPGEGFALGLGAVNSVGNLRRPMSFASLPRMRPASDGAIPVARLVDMLTSPGTSYHYNGEIRTYPEIRLIYWAGGNPFHHHQDLNRLRSAWRGPETVIVHEPHWTPLARHADIVLPATLSAERTDIAGSPRDTHLFANEAVVPPHREARDDHVIFAGLAARLAAPEGNTPLEHAFTEGRDTDGWLRYLYEETRTRMARAGENMPDYDQFRRQGYYAFERPDDPPTLLTAFRADPVANALPTPSGRIEIFSETIAVWGLEGQPGHPVWHPPKEWLGAELAGRFPLHLVSHQPARRLHSQLDQSSYSKAGKIGGRTPVVMHPKDAAARGLTEGETVLVHNERGRCLAGLRCDPGLCEGVVTMETGAWFDPDPRDPRTCRAGNPNMLTADRPTSEIAQGPAALNCLVEISRAPDKSPAPDAHRPPRILKRPK